MPFKSRPCRECGQPIELRIARDLHRKWFCGHSCRARWYGKLRDMEPLRKLNCTPESNARKGQHGQNHNKWKPVGTRSLWSNGYVKVKIAEDLWNYEHRVVAKADADQVTHHKNGIKTDNRPENLQPMTRREHGILHAQERRQ